MRVPFLFNPKEFSVEKSNQYAEVSIPGLSSPVFQFVRGNARSVTMDLFFDTYEEGEDVRFHTDRITGLGCRKHVEQTPRWPERSHGY